MRRTNGPPFVVWASEQCRTFQRVEIRTAEGDRIAADLFEPARNLLIEAKFTTARKDIRMAIGQLFDYATQIGGNPSMALLLPRNPAPSQVKALDRAGISTIVEDSAGKFLEHLGAAN